MNNFLITRHLVKAFDIGVNFNLYGGRMMDWLDEAGALYALERFPVEVAYVLERFLVKVAYVLEKMLYLCTQKRIWQHSI